MSDPDDAVSRRREALWAGLALRGIAWLALICVVPFYVIVCVAFGSVDPMLESERPIHDFQLKIAASFGLKERCGRPSAWVRTRVLTGPSRTPST